jgi:tRNA (guanine37-N1)-methyltransferase
MIFPLLQRKIISLLNVSKPSYLLLKGLNLKTHLKEILSELLSPEDQACIYNSYDIVGDIAIIRLTEASQRYSQAIAESILRIHKNVKTVLAQASPVCGAFRLRKLEFIAGENKTSTVHKESGCSFSVDVRECYFSPRLSYERMRIAKQVENEETIVNMFAGVGCFSIVIAKHSNADKIYSIDINPVAFQNMQENVRLNGAYDRVVPMLGDAKDIIKKRLYHVADRVLMPLPEKAYEYLPHALLALKKAGGWIYYYEFEHAEKNEDPIVKTSQKVAEKLGSLSVNFQIPFGRVVRATGPNWYQVVLDIEAKP